MTNTFGDIRNVVNDIDSLNFDDFNTELLKMLNIHVESYVDKEIKKIRFSFFDKYRDHGDFINEFKHQVNCLKEPSVLQDMYNVFLCSLPQYINGYIDGDSVKTDDIHVFFELEEDSIVAEGHLIDHNGNRKEMHGFRFTNVEEFCIGILNELSFQVYEGSLGFNYKVDSRYLTLVNKLGINSFLYGRNYSSYPVSKEYHMFFFSEYYGGRIEQEYPLELFEDRLKESFIKLNKLQGNIKINYVSSQQDIVNSYLYDDKTFISTVYQLLQKRKFLFIKKTNYADSKYDWMTDGCSFIIEKEFIDIIEKNPIFSKFNLLKHSKMIYDLEDNNFVKKHVAIDCPRVSYPEMYEYKLSAKEEDDFILPGVFFEIFKYYLDVVYVQKKEK